MKAISRSPAKP